MQRRGRWARARWPKKWCALATMFGLLMVAQRADAQCIDEAIRDELNARRQYRGVQERLFQKERRHELSVLGGVYAADLTSSSWLAGGAYTYHITEDFGLEASFGYTRSRSELIRIVEDRLATDLVKENVPVFLYQGHLILDARLWQAPLVWQPHQPVRLQPRARRRHHRQPLRARSDGQRRARAQVLPDALPRAAHRSA